MTEARHFAGKSAGLADDLIIPLLGLARTLLLPSLDALCILIVPICQISVTTTLQNPRQYLVFWALLALTTILLTSSHGGYRHWQEHRSHTAKLAVRCFAATAIAMLTAAILLGHNHVVARHWTTAELILPPLLLVFTRTVTAASLVSAPASNGPLVVCLNRCPGDLAKALAEQKIATRPAGVLFLSPPLDPTGGWPEIANIQTLLEMIRSRSVKDVIFIYDSALEDISSGLRKALLSDLLAFPVRIWLALSLAPELPRPLGGGGGCRLVPVANDRLLNSRNAAKRAFDIGVGVLLLAAAMPVLGLIALAVRLSGPGPVVFRQNRTGAHGHQFKVLKFRTMRHGASPCFAQAVPGDTRVTRIGRLLRRSSLDELLQLVNVIRGDMSLVGPRPHAPETQVQGIDFEQAVQYYRLRHRVKPGMTGLAQIRGHRGETPRLETLESRIASDLEYIDTWSIWLDVMIILRTLPTLIGHRNAY